MSTLLVRNATVLATMDDDGTEIPGGCLYVEDGFITAVGGAGEVPDTADEVFDATDHVVLPGLVNTHHHLYQTLTRAVPGAQDCGLFDWLRTLYPIWARMGPDHIRISTQVGLAELALSGCTTVSDHLYLFPNGSSLDDEIEAAGPVGLRLHASRGSMSLGESDGGLPPDSVVQAEAEILADSARLVDAYHDPNPGAMVQVVLAPCSPFSVTAGAMRDAAELARDRGVHLHTHLAETLDEEEFCLATHGMRPVALMETLGWFGDDVWFAHGVFIDEQETARLAETRTGIAHCPSSNMRLGSGIAPVRRYLSHGVPVGIGVDGSASNDGNHLLGEARQAMLLARLAAAPSLEGGRLLTARESLRMATRGGAAVLGRDDIGALVPGRCADLIAVSLERVEYAGALHDPVAALVFAAPIRVDRSWVHGRPVVVDGRLATLEVGPLVAEHNRLAAELV